MPAENDPADPNALTQSWQLTCSLTPRSTVPSTRWVIIWLKRCLARSPIDAPLESAPVTTGGACCCAPDDEPSPSPPPSQSLPHPPSVSAADAGGGCNGICTSQIAAVSAADPIKLRVIFVMISARTACRWDRCRHRQEWHPKN